MYVCTTGERAGLAFRRGAAETLLHVPPGCAVYATNKSSASHSEVIRFGSGGAWMQSARSPLQARAAPHVQPAPVRRPFLHTSKKGDMSCAPPPTDDAAVNPPRAEHYGIDENLPQSVRPQVHWAFLYWGVAPEFQHL